MKIEGSRTTALTGNATPALGPRSAKATSQNGRPSSQDSVTLSGISTQIQALESSISEASGFDAAKVDAIKQAISEGKFTINPEAIADKLISSTRDLLSRQH